MATKTKKKAAAAAETNGKPTVPEPIDILDLDDEIEKRVNPGQWNNPARRWSDAYIDAKRRVEELQTDLDLAKSHLELLAAPLRVVEREFDLAKLERLATAKPHDAAIKATFGRIRLKVQSSKYNSQKRRYETKDSGAKPWKQLAAEGATDAQIEKNVDSVEMKHEIGEVYMATSSGGLALFLRDGHGDRKPIVTGKAKILAEVRRVFEIPAITEKPKATMKAPARKKRTAAKPKSSKPRAKPGKPKAAERTKKVSSPAKSSKPAAAAAKARAAKAGPKSPAKEKSSKPADEQLDDVARCCVCGCTEDEPCEGGCWWAEDPAGEGRDVCSNCVDKLANVRTPIVSPTANGRTVGDPFATGGGTATLTAPAKKKTAAVDSADLRAQTLNSLKPMDAALLDEIIAAHPQSIAKGDVMDQANYQPGGKVSQAFRRLLVAGHITEPKRGQVRAADYLFQEE